MAKSLSLRSYGSNNLFGTDAEKKRREAEAAIADYRPFEFENADDYQNARNAYLNREAFKYDVNDDVMYKAYKDMYERQGNLAMKDTVGQVAAMSGGYGNSYAQTAGQQIYQAYMDTLGDRVPELYNMALNAYQLEGDRLAQNYSALQNERQNAYNEHMDALNLLLTDRDYYANRADTEWNRDYTTQRAAVSDEQWNKSFDWQVNKDQRDFDYNKEIADRNFNYTVEQDALADSWRQKEWDAANNSGKYTVNSYSGGNYPTPTGNVTPLIGNAVGAVSNAVNDVLGTFTYGKTKKAIESAGGDSSNLMTAKEFRSAQESNSLYQGMSYSDYLKYYQEYATK